LRCPAPDGGYRIRVHRPAGAEAAAARPACFRLKTPVLRARESPPRSGPAAGPGGPIVHRTGEMGRLARDGGEPAARPRGTKNRDRTAWRIIWCCCTPTATDKFIVGDWWLQNPRPARGVRKGLSRTRGNSHVRLLGEGATATSYATPLLARSKCWK